MHPDTLQLANRLSKGIIHRTEQLETIRSAREFSLGDGFSLQMQNGSVAIKADEMEEIKLILMRKWEQELADLQKQFDAL